MKLNFGMQSNFDPTKRNPSKKSVKKIFQKNPSKKSVKNNVDQIF